MVLMGANPFRGPLEGVGPENETLLGPEMATSKADRKRKPEQPQDFRF